MTVSRVCYCTREMVMKAMDIKFTARSSDAVDRAIETAADNIEGNLHRVFFPIDDTREFDYPNYQFAVPWRLYLEHDEIADITTNVPVVKSGGTVIPAAQLVWYPLNESPPFRWVETNRSNSSQTFGIGSTPQADVAITATFGYWTRKIPAGTLASAVNNSVLSLQVSDGSKVGVGDLLIIDSERFLVTEKAMVTTAQTQQSAGAGTANKADVLLSVTDGTKYTAGEIILLDAERMLIIDIAGNTLSVIRGWDGTVLATHSGATVFAARLLTVTRGEAGSTAASHSQNASCFTSLVPYLIRDLALAEASVQKELEIGGYAGTQGQGASSSSSLGEGLADKWDEAQTKYGRQLRVGAI